MQPAIHTPTDNQSLLQLLLRVHSRKGIFLRITLSIGCDCFGIEEVGKVEMDPFYCEFIGEVALLLETVDLILAIVFRFAIGVGMLRVEEDVVFAIDVFPVYA